MKRDPRGEAWWGVVRRGGAAVWSLVAGVWSGGWRAGGRSQGGLDKPINPCSVRVNQTFRNQSRQPQSSQKVWSTNNNPLGVFLLVVVTDRVLCNVVLTGLINYIKKLKTHIQKHVGEFPDLQTTDDLLNNEFSRVASCGGEMWKVSHAGLS